VRLFLMFMKPWEQDAPWSSTGITGLSRFLDRVWTVTLAPHGQESGGREEDASRGGGDGGTSGSQALRALAHRKLKRVTDDYEGFHFNTMVARLIELTNALMRYRGTAVAGSQDWEETIRLLLLMLAPAAPHITEELWSRRLTAAGEPWRSIHQEAWPAVDEALAAEETMELPVQVNGKLRDRVPMAVGLPRAEVEEIVRAREKVQAALGGQEPLRTVYVDGRLINFVVR
ncbi:MAG: class I tRNA ligase family protein, partial [Candidatus Limnocylindrales bacterium]